jgi:streptogramin lyase
MVRFAFAALFTGALWVSVSSCGSDNDVSGPDDRPLPSQLAAPGGEPRGLAWDGTHLWVVTGPEEGPIISRLDPRTGSVQRSFTAPGSRHRDLAWDGEALWYSAHSARRIYRLDPSDGSVLVAFDSPGDQPRGLAWDGTNLWHSDASGPERTIYRLSPDDGEVLESFPSPVTLPVGLDWDGSHLWTSQLSGGGALVRFDREGNALRTIGSPAAAIVGLAFDPAGPWLWGSDAEEPIIHRIEMEAEEEEEDPEG